LPDKKGYPGPPGWVLGLGLTSISRKSCLENPIKKKPWPENGTKRRRRRRRRRRRKRRR